MYFFILVLLMTTSFVLIKLDKSLKDKQTFITMKGEDILVIKSIHGYHFITKTKTLFYSSRVEALLYLFRKGYVPFNY